MSRPPITPEVARELLNNATPGPWNVVGEDEEYPRVARDGYMDITNDAAAFNAPLIAAAPELAAVVAGLRVEYMVIGATGYMEEDGEILRFTDLADARSLSQLVHPSRIVARFVTTEPWEVVE